MANLKKTKNGTWQATVYIGREANGKMKRKYITRATKKEAKLAAEELEREIAENKFIDIDHLRLITYATKWLDLHKLNLAPETYKNYTYYVNHTFQEYFGDIQLNRLTEIHIRDFLNYESEKGLSNTTIRKHFFVLRKILKDAMRDKSPCRYIDPPSPQKHIPHVITDEEFQQIHNYVRGTFDELPILLAGWCGLRRGELFALRVNDLDFSSSTIRVDENQASSVDGTVYKGPKSRNGYRTMIVPPYLMNLLADYIRKQSLIGMNDLIFDIKAVSYSKRFHTIILDLGLEGIRFHDLRHYHATFLHNSGIDDFYAANRMGHDINVMRGIYQHLQIDRKETIDTHLKNTFQTKKFS